MDVKYSSKTLVTKLQYYAALEHKIPRYGSPLMLSKMSYLAYS